MLCWPVERCWPADWAVAMVPIVAAVTETRPRTAAALRLAMRFMICS
ncbi:MAG: hypothetical protein R2731_19095 [Nocardioides sp.]